MSQKNTIIQNIIMLQYREAFHPVVILTSVLAVPAVAFPILIAFPLSLAIPVLMAASLLATGAEIIVVILHYRNSARFYNKKLC